MSGEKTELPTEQKLREAKKKGQVALSKDIVHVFSLGAGFLIVFTDAFGMVTRVSKLFAMPFGFIASPQSLNPRAHLVWVLTEIAWISMPILLIVFLASYLGVFSQIGMHVSAEAVKPSFKKFDVVGNLKNLFSKKSLLQLLMSILKILVLTLVSFLALKGSVNSLVLLPQVGVAGGMSFFAQVVTLIAVYSLMSFLLMAILDWVIIKRHHIKSLMMSKQEIFQEYKNNEGDPYLKSHRKQMGRELVEKSPEETLSESSAVVVNPTHIAICLRFLPDTDPLPFVLSIKDGPEAQRLMKLARQMGVPIVRHVQFARDIHKKGYEQSYVPSSQVKAAALIIRSVQQWLELDQEERGRAAEWTLN